MVATSDEALKRAQAVTDAVRDLEAARLRAGNALRQLGALIAEEIDLNSEMCTAVVAETELFADYIELDGNGSVYSSEVVQRDAVRIVALAEAAILGVTEDELPAPARELLVFDREVREDDDE